LNLRFNLLRPHSYLRLSLLVALSLMVVSAPRHKHFPKNPDAEVWGQAVDVAALEPLLVLIQLCNIFLNKESEET
jgi:hypothetical protein